DADESDYDFAVQGTGTSPAVSNNARLSNLTISQGTLTPAFTPGNTGYNDAVPNSVSSLTVTPTAADAGATIQVRINGGSFTTVTSGTASPSLSLNVGNNPIDVKVTAADGITTKTYTIIVNRGATANNWYVNDNSTAGDVYTSAVGNDATGTGSTTAPFATLNRAMTAASNGDIIYVDAGDYTEFINVTKSLRFYGSNNTISKNNIATPRVAETVIHAPSSPQPDANGITIFEVRTSGVNIEVKGFKLMNGNPIHDGHYHRDGSNLQNISVLFEKNWVQNADHLFAGTLSRWSNVIVRDNFFDNINFVAGNSSAIQLNDAVTGISGPHTATMTATIEDNVINTTEFAGILLDNIAAANVWRNKLSNLKGEAGIQLAGGMGSATVTMNEITNANTTVTAATDKAGIKIYGSQFTGSISISNNLVAGSQNGFAVTNGEAITNTNIHVNGNSFSGSTSKSMYHGGTDAANGGSTPSPNTLDGECNWHGTAIGSAVAAGIQGPIDFETFLTDGTDTDPATIGFQPTASCNGVKTIAPPPDVHIRIFPMPVINTLDVEYTSPARKKIDVIIVDQAGRIIQKENTVVMKGINTMHFDVHRLIKGTYTVIISDGVEQQHEKMVKM
ncbi:MAG: cadherin-like beta sandwich domain-containing protein, partial [Flavisolibacter sp.]